MKRQFKLMHVTAAFLCGSIFFSGLAMAMDSKISVSFDKLRFLVQGVDRSSADGQFNNQGQKVPESIVFKGTTYVPIRLLGNLFEQPVHWEGATKTVWIGQVHVPLVNAQGTAIGNAKLSPVEKGVRVNLEASQLSPGKHGFICTKKCSKTTISRRQADIIPLTAKSTATTIRKDAMRATSRI